MNPEELRILAEMLMKDARTAEKLRFQQHEAFRLKTSAASLESARKRGDVRAATRIGEEVKATIERIRAGRRAVEVNPEFPGFADIVPRALPTRRTPTPDEAEVIENQRKALEESRAILAEQLALETPRPGDVERARAALADTEKAIAQWRRERGLDIPIAPVKPPVAPVPPSPPVATGEVEYEVVRLASAFGPETVAGSASTFSEARKIRVEFDRQVREAGQGAIRFKIRARTRPAPPVAPVPPVAPPPPVLSPAWGSVGSDLVLSAPVTVGDRSISLRAIVWKDPAGRIVWQGVAPGYTLGTTVYPASTIREAQLAGQRWIEDVSGAFRTGSLTGESLVPLPPPGPPSPVTGPAPLRPRAPRAPGVTEAVPVAAPPAPPVPAAAGEIPRTPVESSNLAAIGYDAATRTLAIEFRNGGVYNYANVPPIVWEGMQKAESKGQFFLREIKTKPKEYPFTKVASASPGAALRGEVTRTAKPEPTPASPEQAPPRPRAAGEVIPHITVTSSYVASIGYSPETWILEIRFNSGAVTAFHNVPMTVASEMLNAESKGKYFLRKIKPYPKLYPSEIVRGEPAPGMTTLPGEGTGAKVALESRGVTAEDVARVVAIDAGGVAVQWQLVGENRIHVMVERGKAGLRKSMLVPWEGYIERARAGRPVPVEAEALPAAPPSPPEPPKPPAPPGAPAAPEPPPEPSPRWISPRESTIAKFTIEDDKYLRVDDFGKGWQWVVRRFNPALGGNMGPALAEGRAASRTEAQLAAEAAAREIPVLPFPAPSPPFVPPTEAERLEAEAVELEAKAKRSRNEFAKEDYLTKARAKRGYAADLRARDARPLSDLPVPVEWPAPVGEKQIRYNLEFEQGNSNWLRMADVPGGRIEIEQVREDVFDWRVIRYTVEGKEVTVSAGRATGKNALGEARSRSIEADGEFAAMQYAPTWTAPVIPPGGANWTQDLISRFFERHTLPPVGSSGIRQETVIEREFAGDPYTWSVWRYYPRPGGAASVKILVARGFENRLDEAKRLAEMAHFEGAGQLPTVPPRTVPYDVTPPLTMEERIARAEDTARRLDWYAEYSDDYSVVLSGSGGRTMLIKMLNEVPPNEARRIWDTFAPKDIPNPFRMAPVPPAPAPRTETPIGLPAPGVEAPPESIPMTWIESAGEFKSQAVTRSGQFYATIYREGEAGLWRWYAYGGKMQPGAESRMIGRGGAVTRADAEYDAMRAILDVPAEATERIVAPLAWRGATSTEVRMPMEMAETGLPGWSAWIQLQEGAPGARGWNWFVGPDMAPAGTLKWGWTMSAGEAKRMAETEIAKQAARLGR